jgi:SNF2 family DNA or RNA helicase
MQGLFIYLFHVEYFFYLPFFFSSTMPVKSTVQTPELFKGTLKEYQLKGLQWLVNCYEQVTLS